MEFKKLNTKVEFESIWDEYQKYIKVIDESISDNISLMQKDKSLWGKSFFKQLEQDVKNEFQPRNNNK